MGVSLGDVATEALGLVTLVGRITISASTYMIVCSHQLYAWLAPLLGVFERKVTVREPDGFITSITPKYDVLLFGLGRFGGAIAQRLRVRGYRVLGNDLNSAAIKLAR